MGLLDSLSSALPSADKVSGLLKGAAPALGGLAGAALGDKLGIGKVAGAIAGFAATSAALSPSATRMAGAGIFGGGANSSPAGAMASIAFGSGGGSDGSGGENDWRVRLTLPPMSPVFFDAFLIGNVLNPLAQDKGVVFPYTPQVSMTHTAKYDGQSLAHTNYTFYTYTGSETGAISINADFSVQNKIEANYVMAAIYFFRAATKMFYGYGNNVGNPPPVLWLSGYGKYLLNKIPCVITSFSHTMPNDVDYMSDSSNTDVDSEGNWLPTWLSMAITVQPVVSRSKQSAFNLDKFASGELIGGNFGGFL